MRKIIITLLALTFLFHTNIFGQQENPLLLKILDKAGDKFFLKDYPYSLQPNKETQIAFKLNKRTNYAIYFNIPKANQLDIRLYNSRNSIVFNNRLEEQGITYITTKSNKTETYRLVIKNISKKPVSSMAVLLYDGRYNPKEEEKYTNAKLNNLLDLSEGIYLKDFYAQLEPNSDTRYSIILSKNSVYEVLYYSDHLNDIDFKLYSNEELISPSVTNSLSNITTHEYRVPKTGVYHVFIKNKSDKETEALVLLNFLKEVLEPISKDQTISEKTKNEEIKDSESVYFQVDDMPKFIGEIKDFKKYISKHLSYPQEALEKEIKGTVYIQFTVAKNGYIKDAKIARGVHPSLNQEALRIVYSSPKWKPGIKDGKPVDVVLTYPIIFKLP